MIRECLSALLEAAYPDGLTRTELLARCDMVDDVKKISHTLHALQKAGQVKFVDGLWFLVPQEPQPAEPVAPSAPPPEPACADTDTEVDQEAQARLTQALDTAIEARILQLQYRDPVLKYLNAARTTLSALDNTH